MKRIAVFVCLALSSIGAQASETAVTSDTASAVSQALNLPYMKIYRGAPCEPKEIESRWYIRCAPKEVTGGIWAISKGPTLVPMNGKAKTHAENLSDVILANGEIVPVKEWKDAFPGEIPDVAKVMGAFQ